MFVNKCYNLLIGLVRTNNKNILQTNCYEKKKSNWIYLHASPASTLFHHGIHCSSLRNFLFTCTFINIKNKKPKEKQEQRWKLVVNLPFRFKCLSFKAFFTLNLVGALLESWDGPNWQKQFRINAMPNAKTSKFSFSLLKNKNETTI